MTATIIPFPAALELPKHWNAHDRGARINPERVDMLAAEIERVIDSPRNDRERKFSIAMKNLQR